MIKTMKWKKAIYFMVGMLSIIGAIFAMKHFVQAADYTWSTEYVDGATLKGEDNASVYRYVEATDSYVFIDCLKALRNLTIPDMVNGKPVTDMEADFPVSVINLKLGANLTSIPSTNALTALKTLVVYCPVSESLSLENSILTSAEFHGEVSAAISYPSTLRSVAYYANLTYFPSFNNEDGTQFPVLNTVIMTTCDGEMPQMAFSDCKKLTTLVLPTNLTSVSDYAFRRCYLLPIQTLPKTVTRIGRLAFFKCYAITEFQLSRAITSIGEKAFANCEQLTNFTFSMGVQSLGSSVWSNTAILSMTVPSSLTQYDELAFADMKQLKSLTFNGNLPTALRLSSDTALQTLMVKGKCERNPILPCSIITVKYLKGNTTFPCFNNQSLVYDEATKRWVHPYNHLQTVRVAYADSPIPQYAFAGCSSLTTLSLPKDVTVIGAYAFLNCTQLKSLKIPTRVQQIGEGVFSGTCFTSYIFPTSLVSIGDYAFENCPNLYQVVIKNMTATIGEDIFRGCSQKVTLVAPKESKAALLATQEGLDTTYTRHLKIYTKTRRLYVGASLQLSVYNTSEAVRYMSMDSSIVKVSKEGLVTAVSRGTAQIQIRIGKEYYYVDYQVVSRTKNAVVRYLNTVYGMKNLTMEEKINILDDWLCENVAYDLSGYEKGEASERRKSANGAIVDGVALADGYALAMKTFLDYYGIENTILYGTVGKMPHVVNKIRIDNSWKYVDVAWNDTVIGTSTNNKYSSKRFFLLTKSELTKAYKWNIKTYGVKELSPTYRTILSAKYVSKNPVLVGQKLEGTLKLSFDDGSLAMVPLSEVKMLSETTVTKGLNKLEFEYMGQILSVSFQAYANTVARSYWAKHQTEYKNADYAYTSNSTTVFIERVTTESYTYLLAHVVVNSPSQLHGGMSYDTYGGERELPTNASKRKNWILGTNGSYFYYDNGEPALAGVFIKNGVVYKNLTTKGTELALTSEGVLYTPKKGLTAEDLLAEGVTDVWGSPLPALIEDGILRKVESYSTSTYPRTAWGMVAPGEYYVLVAGDNNYSKGLTLAQVRDIMYAKGCTYAKCLDQGGSSSMVYLNQLINTPAAGDQRAVPDFIYITD